MSVVSRDVTPCPLCGSPAVLVDCDTPKGKVYTVICLDVQRCGLGSGFCNTKDDALKGWKGQIEYAELVKGERRDRA